MKTWIRRTLIGVAASAALLGGLAAWAGHSHRGCWSENRAEAKACFVDMASRKLDLDAAQKAKLDALATQVQAQRAALVPAGRTPKVELQALIGGNSFDRTAAGALLQAKLQAVQTGAPALINAFGDFYDSLRPEQQSQLREALQRGRPGHHGRHGPRG